MDSFGERLKTLIKGSDLKSIKNFSEKSHFSTVAVSNVINGKSKPSFDFIMACLNVLPKVDLNWLISGQGIAEKLEMENRHLREEIELQEKRLGIIAKRSSSRVNSQKQNVPSGLPIRLPA